MIFTQLIVEDAAKDQNISQSSQSLGRIPPPTFSLQIPTTDICKSSSVRSSATCLSIPHESMSSHFPQASKFLSWKAKFTYETWAPVQANPGTWAEGSQLNWHGFALVLFPDLQLTLHKREVSVTQFADRLPRGHDLSMFLVPSSADVLDPVWNAHTRNPGKQQSFHKSGSDLVVRQEPSVRRHHLSNATFITNHRNLQVRVLRETLVWGVLFDNPRQASRNVVPQRAPAMLGPCQGRLFLFLEENLLTLKA